MVVPLAAAVAVPLAVAAAAAAAEWETPGFRDSGRLLQLVSNASLRRSTVGIGRGARRGETSREQYRPILHWFTASR